MRQAVVVSALGALVGTVLVAIPGGATQAAPAVGDHYVSFGDSFVSGPGIRPIRQAGCERSEVNFPSQVAAALGVETFTDASCGGARTEHLAAPQVRQDFTNPPQLDAIDANTTLITFGTLGGNDINLVGIAGNCVIQENCVTQPGDAGHPADRIAPAIDRMADGIDDARAISPHAEIYLVGYGTYLPASGCPATLPGISPAEAEYIQAMIDELSEAIGQLAEDEGLPFVDMRELPWAGHTVCAAPENQWIRGLTTYDDGALMHPSGCGHVAMAQQVLRTIRAERGETVPEFDDSCRGAGGPGTPTDPPGQPAGPTVAERTAALKSALASTRLKVSCQAGKVRAKVKGGQKRIARVQFRVGSRKIAVDRSAPYTMTRKAKRLAQRKGKVKAVVRVRDAELQLKRTLKVKRPRCLRR